MKCILQTSNSKSPDIAISKRVEGYLQESDGEFWMHFGGDPESEVVVHLCDGRVGHGVDEFGDVVERQVAVLQKNPVAALHRLLHVSTRVHLLALTHRDRAQLCITQMIAIADCR